MLEPVSVAAPPSASAPLAAMLLGGAAVAFYFAVRAVIDVFANRPVLAMALAAILPTTAAALVAVGFGRTSAAFAVIYGAAVGSVTLVLGLGLSTRSEGKLVPGDVAPASGTLLPIALAVLLAGFTGSFGPLAAGLLLVAGLAILLPAWPTVTAVVATPGGPTPWPLRGLQLLLALALTAAAALLVGAGSEHVDQRAGRDLLAVSATMLAAPMIALPLVGLATAHAAAGRRAVVVAGCTAAASGLLGVVLPLTLIVAQGRVLGMELTGWADLAVTLPLRLWRVDSTVVAIVGILLLPAAARRWQPGGLEGLGLVALYVAYLVVSVMSSR